MDWSPVAPAVSGLAHLPACDRCPEIPPSWRSRPTSRPNPSSPSFRRVIVLRRSPATGSCGDRPHPAPECGRSRRGVPLHRGQGVVVRGECASRRFSAV